jgi:NAD(P)-dependent dehydrogenase (short-subunit alcohol dehydrogenase family)
MSDQPVALITGASRGIGAATAQAFSQAGYRLAIVATNEAALQEVADGLATPSLVLVGDLAEMAFTETIVPQAVARFGRIDVLVNNAAWRELGSMRRITVDNWERTLRICLTAPAFLARWAAEDMERRKRGVILNISSIMALHSAGISPAYVACKGGIDALTFELASVYGPAGIRAVSIQPGAIDTELSRSVGQADHADEIRQYSEDMIMLGRWGRPEEIADALLFLASERASYITGTTLAIDGGWLRQHMPLSLKRRHFEDDYP